MCWALLFISFLGAIAVLDPPRKPRRVKLKKGAPPPLEQADLDRYKKKKKKKKGTPPPEPAKEESEEELGFVQTLSSDILSIAPRIYSGIELEMVGGGYLDKGDRSFEDLTPETVRTIEVHVKSNAWDELQSSGKVDLLRRTFKFIPQSYPNLTQLVKLKFDDGRKDLEIRFEENR